MRVVLRSRMKSEKDIFNTIFLASSVNEIFPLNQIDEPGLSIQIMGFGVIETTKLPNLPSPAMKISN